MTRRLSAAKAQVIAEAGLALARAPNGQRGAIVQAAAAATGLSAASVYRHISALTVQEARRQRSDAGTTGLVRRDAERVSDLIMESARKNAKRLITVADAVAITRADGSARCEVVDAATGEIKPLSVAAITAGLRVHGLHPKQLTRPRATNRMRSLHPNHVWEIDASLCVLYYLSNGRDGLHVLDQDKYYKNKPAALERVAAERVWRYVVTDHYSGSLFVHYVMGAESALNLAESFIAAICPRTPQGQADPFCGVPAMLYMDRGSANTSGPIKNLLRRLGVRQEAHMPGAPWATGQVEKAQDIVERRFESALRFQPVRDLAELNAQAAMWSCWFNATATHSRHGKTRRDVWLRIAPEELRVPPSAAVCRELLTTEPVTRSVSSTLTVSFQGQEYSVRTPDLAWLNVGDKVQVCANPYVAGAASVVDTDAQGHERLITIEPVVLDAAGFDASSAVFGEYRARPQTPADAERAAQKRRVYGAADDAAVQAAIKARALPFGGTVDPLRAAREAVLPTPLPKAGTPVLPTAATPATDAIAAAAAAPRVLTQFEACARLAAAGVAMDAERFGTVRQWYANGVPETELPLLQERLTARAGLRVIPGGQVANG